MGNPTWDKTLNEFVPMFAEQGVKLAVPVDLDGFLNPLGVLKPGAHNPVIVHLTIQRPTKMDLNRSPLCGVSTAMDHRLKVFTITQLAAPGATGTRPVKDQLNGIQQRGLAAAIHPAEKHNWLLLARRSKHKRLPTSVYTKLAQH